MEKQAPEGGRLKDTMKRSIVKSVSYRLLIITLDFTTVYLFTGQIKMAVERIWEKIKWGKEVISN
jgi:uncharacterized membrane protein